MTRITVQCATEAQTAHTHVGDPLSLKQTTPNSYDHVNQQTPVSEYVVQNRLHTHYILLLHTNKYIQMNERPADNKCSRDARSGIIMALWRSRFLVSDLGWCRDCRVSGQRETPFWINHERAGVRLGAQKCWESQNASGSLYIFGLTN